MSKILFVVTELRMGGRERVVTEVAEGFQSQGVHTEIFSLWKRTPYFDSAVSVVFGLDKAETLVSTNNQGPKSGIVEFVKNKILVPVAKMVIPYSLLQRKRFKSLASYIAANHVTDVVLTDLTISGAAIIRKKNPNVNLIGWIHMEASAFFDKQYKYYKRELLKNLDLLDEVVALTDRQAEQYKEFSNNVTAIPNPMPAVKESRPIREQKHVIVVSRIDVEHKGLDYFAQVVAKLPLDVSVSIAGAAQSFSEQDLFNRILKKYGVFDRVKQLGALSGDDLDAFYNSGSVFLMTSKFEGFPMTLGEAMSYGLPIVAFDIDGTNAVLEGGEYGLLIPSFDVDQMSKSVQELLNNPALYEKFLRKSKNRVDNFGISSVVHQWEKILKGYKS